MTGKGVDWEVVFANARAAQASDAPLGHGDFVVHPSDRLRYRLDTIQDGTARCLRVGEEGEPLLVEMNFPVAELVRFVHINLAQVLASDGPVVIGDTVEEVGEGIIEFLRQLGLHPDS